MLRNKSLRFGILACAAALAVACSSEPKAEAAKEAPAAKARVAAGRIAIFDFEVKGGGEAYAGLGSEIPAALSESFLKGGLLRPVEREAIDKALAEQELALSGLADEATAARVGRLAGARYALLGTATVIGDQVRLSCRIIDIETAELLYAASAHGAVKELFAVLDGLAREVQEGCSR